MNALTPSVVTLLLVACAATAPRERSATQAHDDIEQAMARVNRETLSILERGSYRSPSGRAIDVRAGTEAAVRGSKLYTPEALDGLLSSRAKAARESTSRPRIEVTEEKTLQAVRRLAQEAAPSIAALSFASAVDPAGAFPEGAGTQEEDLVRCSALWPCLLAQPRYFEANRAEGTPFYTDHLIYSPDVPFFRTDDLALVEAPIKASIISAPAPFAAQILARDPSARPRIREVLRIRAGKVLAAAAEQGNRTLVLGAWGCGAFGNDARDMAAIFAEWLESPAFAGAFDRVVFATYDPKPGKPRLTAFKVQFEGSAGAK